MSLMRPGAEPGFCIECVMAWLLYGDGAICLLHREPVYWRKPTHGRDDNTAE